MMKGKSKTLEMVPTIRKSVLRNKLVKRLGIKKHNYSRPAFAYLFSVLEEMNPDVNPQEVKEAMAELAAQCIFINVAIEHIIIELLSKQKPKKYVYKATKKGKSPNRNKSSK